MHFYTAIDLLSGGEDGLGYRKATGECAKAEGTGLAIGKARYTKPGG